MTFKYYIRPILALPVFVLWVVQSLVNAVLFACNVKREWHIEDLFCHGDVMPYRVSARLDTQHKPVYYDFADNYLQAKKTAKGVLRALQERELKASNCAIFIDKWHKKSECWIAKKTFVYSLTNLPCKR